MIANSNSIKRNTLYAIISGLVLGLAFAIPSLFFLIFFAFVPLLQIEATTRFAPNKYLIFNYSAIAFFIWNTISYWWIGSAHLLGVIFIIIANTLLQATVFWLISRSRTILKKPILIFWIIIWLGFEYFHSNWELSWTWLNLGNVFANTPKIIQWYEFTGTRGGTLWIIIVNFMIFKILTQKQNRISNSTLLLTVIVIPISISAYLFVKPINAINNFTYAIIQPNKDPYTQKFRPENKKRDFEQLLATTDSICNTKQTDFVIAPETAILSFIDESAPTKSIEYQKLKQLSDKYPKTKIIVGTHSSSNYPRRKYNSAMLISKQHTQFYHKHWLVPLFEYVPFANYLKFIANKTINLGGYKGTYNKDNKIAYFKTDSIAITPIVCYESIFGAYCAKRIAQKQGFIVLITNDGWWKNTPGYFYHFNFSRLRAIEGRREIIRAANNGISAHINSKGIVTQQTQWWTKAELKGKLNYLKETTYYTKNGDYLGRISLFFGIFVLIYVKIRNFTHK